MSTPCLKTLCDKENEVLQTAGLTAGLVISLYILFMSCLQISELNVTLSEPDLH